MWEGRVAREGLWDAIVSFDHLLSLKASNSCFHTASVIPNHRCLRCGSPEFGPRIPTKDLRGSPMLREERADEK